MTGYAVQIEEKQEPKWDKIGKTQNRISRIGYKTEKLLVFFTKIENQMLNNEKSANCNEHQNRKTEVFWHKNRKTDLKNSQNHKTENPNVPLCQYI